MVDGGTVVTVGRISSQSARQCAVSDSRRNTFDEPGTFPYYCIPHPWIVGTVIVEP